MINGVLNLTVYLYSIPTSPPPFERDTRLNQYPVGHILCIIV